VLARLDLTVVAHPEEQPMSQSSVTESPVTCTLLVPGYGLVTCVTETARNVAGDTLHTTLRSAVDADRHRVDRRTWLRIERILGTR